MVVARNNNGKEWLIRIMFGLLGLCGGAFSTALWVKSAVAANSTEIAIVKTAFEAEQKHTAETLLRIEDKLDRALESK